MTGEQSSLLLVIMVMVAFIIGRCAENSTSQFYGFLKVKLRSLTASDVLTVIVTVERGQSNQPIDYLTEVSRKVINILDDNDAVFVCNVHAGPSNHSVADRLTEIIPTIRRFSLKNTSHLLLDPFERQKNDYHYCLNKAKSLHQGWILMLEDDALPLNDLFYSTVLRKLIYNDQKGWQYISFFYPEAWSGYSWSKQSFLELFCLVMIFFYVMRLLQCPLRLHHWKKATFLLSGYLIVILIIGRLRLRKGLGIYGLYKPGNCCIPAVLYEPLSAQKLIDGLVKVKCSQHFPLDLAIPQILPNGRLYQPNQFSHIGFHSSIKGH